MVFTCSPCPISFTSCVSIRFKEWRNLQNHEIGDLYL